MAPKLVVFVGKLGVDLVVVLYLEALDEGTDGLCAVPDRKGLEELPGMVELKGPKLVVFEYTVVVLGLP